MKLGQLSKVTWAFKARAVNPGEIVCSVRCSKCQQNPCLSTAPVCILDNGVGSGMGIALSLWLVSLQSKTQDKESPWGTHSTEVHCASHPQPRRSQAWKRSQERG